MNKNLKKAHALFGGMCFMKKFPKNQILSESLEKNSKESQEETIKYLEKEGEDATKYGEFVTSYFAWVPLSKQKENVEKLENITKKKEK